MHFCSHIHKKNNTEGWRELTPFCQAVVDPFVHLPVLLLHTVAFPSGANYPAGGLPQHMFACHASLTPLIAIQGTYVSESDCSCCLEGGGRSPYPLLLFLTMYNISYSVSNKLIDFHLRVNCIVFFYFLDWK